MSNLFFLSKNKIKKACEKKQADEQAIEQKKEQLAINSLRDEIDQTDLLILQLIQKRFHLVRQIGQLKNKAKLPILDTKREKRVLIQSSLWTKRLGLPAELASELFKLIFKHSRFIQQKKLGKEAKNQ